MEGKCNDVDDRTTDKECWGGQVREYISMIYLPSGTA